MRPARAWVLAAWACSACADEPGRFDAETVLELARTRGDAVGIRHTGVWTTTLTRNECDCPEVLLGGVLSLSINACDLIGQLGGVFATPVIEADGVLLLRFESFPQGMASVSPPPVSMLGPIDADGTIGLGQVSSQTSVFSALHMIVRFDGAVDDHDPDPATGVWTELDGRMVADFRGAVADAHIDCRADYELHAELASSYPPPGG